MLFGTFSDFESLNWEKVGVPSCTGLHVVYCVGLFVRSGGVRRTGKPKNIEAGVFRQSLWGKK